MRLAIVLAASGLVAANAASGAMTPEPVALLQGLDKITARISVIEAPIGTSVRFGTLSVMVRDCERSPPEDPPENAAFLEIYETPPGEDTKRLFSGWMFSSSPALSGLEHAVYDVALLECKAASGSMSPPPPPPASPIPVNPANPRGKTAR